MKPVSKVVGGIVRQLAEDKVVEELIQNITHRKQLNQDLQDFAQIIYLTLLLTDEARLVHLAESRQIKFYLVRIIRTQYFSGHSPYYDQVRKFRDRSSEISPQFADNFQGGRAGAWHE